MISSLEKPYEEYLRCRAKVFVGTKDLTNKKHKCFLYIPKKIGAEPHLYLLVDNYKEFSFWERLNTDEYRYFNFKINISSMESNDPYERYLFKNCHLSSMVYKSVAEEWSEGFIKFEFAKKAILQSKWVLENDKSIRYFHTKSDLLKSQVTAIPKYTGEILRNVINDIVIEDGVEHLGIKSLRTEKYIDRQDANLLIIEPIRPLASLFQLYKQINFLVSCILLITSFAERRRLNWFKCEGNVGNNFITCFNTRTDFFVDKRYVQLIDFRSFEEFLNKTLQQNSLADLHYINSLLRPFLSGVDYTVDAKIVLWNSLIDKVLKNHFQEKSDKKKEEYLLKLNIHLADLRPMKKMIDARNAIAHGDERLSAEIFDIFYDWSTLIERVLLKELKWNNLDCTDVRVEQS